MATWKWEPQSPVYGNYGNANQWTVNAGLSSLARESAQNSNDARPDRQPAELVYTFVRLSGAARAEFEDALRWADLRSHLRAMGAASEGAVTAGQIRAGLEALDSAEAIVLLRIADYGCHGLTGPEFTDESSAKDYGNFIKLCRLDLFSGKHQAAGGSFGLGKAVYWRFSRLQTVLFNSVLAGSEAVDGRTRNRLFGVNQGVVHELDGVGYQGRGYFGMPGRGGHIESIWGDDELVRRLHLTRSDPRPGTSALLVGFYDPDQPDRGLGGVQEIRLLARELRKGVEENFWPLLTRGGLKVRIEIEDGDERYAETVDPEDTYTELVRALRRFDAGDVDETLDGPYSVVARDVPITVSRRKTDIPHDQFVHQAKLVVTLSDAQPDSLENRVCLFRSPEMVVQTIDREFESTTYHAFLVAGAAIDPGAASDEQIRADDFLRFAEPPAHDRWIPGKGSRQASQANLNAHYVMPWVPNLRNIEKEVVNVLIELFGAPPPKPGEPPAAVLRHLRFLQGGQGRGPARSTAPRKPAAEIIDWRVENGRWHVTFEVRAKNRDAGWAVQPALALVGFDGGHDLVEWESLTCMSSGARLVDGTLEIAPAPRGRFVKVTVQGRSIRDLPIPAEESAVEVVLRGTGPLLTTMGEEGR